MSSPNAQPDDAATGLPLFRTWRRVYVFVFGVFVAWVTALTVFTCAVA